MVNRTGRDAERDDLDSGHETADLSKGGMPSRLQQLKLISEIHQQTSQDSLLSQGFFDDPSKITMLIRDIHDLTRSGLSDGAEYKPLPGRLSEHEYVLPKELDNIHSRLVEHLMSDKTNNHFPFRGLLLHGEKGTGKTEYPQFLASCLGDSAEVVMKSVASIRNSSSPGEEIERFYASLEQQARAEGKYYVVLFDEGDQLFAPLSSEFSHSVMTTSDSHSEKRSSSHSRHETSSGGAVDAQGLEMLTSLKSVLGRGITRVFTIVTSNRLEFPGELYLSLIHI